MDGWLVGWLHGTFNRVAWIKGVSNGVCACVLCSFSFGRFCWCVDCVSSLGEGGRHTWGMEGRRGARVSLGHSCLLATHKRGGILGGVEGGIRGPGQNGPKGERWLSWVVFSLRLVFIDLSVSLGLLSFPSRLGAHGMDLSLTGADGEASRNAWRSPGLVKFLWWFFVYVILGFFSRGWVFGIRDRLGQQPGERSLRCCGGAVQLGREGQGPVHPWAW